MNRIERTAHDLAVEILIDAIVDIEEEPCITFIVESGVRFPVLAFLNDALAYVIIARYYARLEQEEE